MERLVRAGILACQVPLDFCPDRQEEILRHLQLEKPGLIIAPLQMQDLSAVDLVKYLKDVVSDPLPAIFIGDAQYAHIQMRLSSLGAFDFLPQSFAMQELLRKVEQAIHSCPQRVYRQLTFVEPIERKKSSAA